MHNALTGGLLTLFSFIQRIYWSEVIINTIYFKFYTPVQICLKRAQGSDVYSITVQI